eukprot:jgi/Astpho2/5936/fgenesh1_pg.00080_%23_130_t
MAAQVPSLAQQPAHVPARQAGSRGRSSTSGSTESSTASSASDSSQSRAAGRNAAPGQRRLRPSPSPSFMHAPDQHRHHSSNRPPSRPGHSRDNGLSSSSRRYKRSRSPRASHSPSRLWQRHGHHKRHRSSRGLQGRHRSSFEGPDGIGAGPPYRGGLGTRRAQGDMRCAGGQQRWRGSPGFEAGLPPYGPMRGPRDLSPPGRGIATGFPRPLTAQERDQVRDQLAMRRPAPNIPSGPRHFHRPLSAAERDELMAVQHRDRMRHLQMQQGRQTGPSGGTARSPEPRQRSLQMRPALASFQQPSQAHRRRQQEQMQPFLWLNHTPRWQLLHVRPDQARMPHAQHKAGPTQQRPLRSGLAGEQQRSGSPITKWRLEPSYVPVAHHDI